MAGPNLKNKAVINKMKKTKKNSKAQITFMIIIGLVVLISISFVIYVVSSSAKKQATKEAVQSKQTRMNVQPIIEYVNQCLDKVSGESLFLMGKQAGYLFQTHGGLDRGGPEPEFGLSDPSEEGDIFLKYGSYLNYIDLKVAYLISRNNMNLLSFYPNYPWITFPYNTYPSPTQIVYSNPSTVLDPNNPSSNLDSFGFLFGSSRLPELYKSIAGSGSMQYDLEVYVKNNMIECADFNIFKPQGYSISSNPDNIFVNVTIGANDVGFRLTYPLTIEYQGEKTSLKDFSKKQNVRLGQIYNEVERIIKDDINDITYYIKT